MACINVENLPTTDSNHDVPKSIMGYHSGYTVNKFQQTSHKIVFV